MLHRLLQQIAEGAHPQTTAALADTLGTTPELVLQMIEQLARQGYLRENIQCADGCESCSLKALCGVKNSGTRLWTVTEKGRQVGEILCDFPT